MFCRINRHINVTFNFIFSSIFYFRSILPAESRFRLRSNKNEIYLEGGGEIILAGLKNNKRNSKKTSFFFKTSTAVLEDLCKTVKAGEGDEEL